MTDKNETVIALLGQPNSGKSTLFNALTGLKQHVGNWPGKTVEKKEGNFEYKGTKYLVADLPGTYSLSANSDEEIITRDYIAGGKADVVCILADSSQLQRSLYMLADYAGIKVPAFLILNMSDVAAEQGKQIDFAAISKKLGIPVVLFSAQDKKNYDGFYAALETAIRKKTILDSTALETKYNSIEAYKEIKPLVPENVILGYSSVWLAAKVVEGDLPVTAKIKAALEGEKKKQFDEEVAKNLLNSKETNKGVLLTGEAKFAWIDELLEGSVASKTQTRKLGKFDRMITHRVWGKPVVILTVLFGLIASFIPALPFMGVGSAIGALINPVTNGLTAIGCPAFIIAIICDVVINSLSFIFKMLGFVFGVTLVFGLLEEVGVMARISYVFDNTMAKLGLQGKSVMPFLVSFGCTMGGAAGARVIDNWGQKVLTIALAWAVPCGAAWAVVPMLSTVWFGGAAPLIIVAILAVMILHMWVTSKVFGRKLVKKEDRCGMIMELPPYHKPKWGALFRYVLGRTKDTFFRVLKIILLVSFIFWLLTFTKSGSMDNSILYKVGQFIEPVTKIFGLGWKNFMAFIVSSLGKEGAIGVLSSIFTDHNMITVGSTVAGGAAANINELLVANVAKPEALAFIFAITFNMPCIVALAATYQETHSAKWTAIIALYYTVGALLIACVAYHIGLLIW
ncbi:ferrous iron transport protein B [Treponema bryantii]|uniref:Ferrous iron transport protein B n=1 Tax=Treponema bryantii TaxID=163 RepID=A0A1H9FM03_9SPIR|nr:ferrous iron transport protein B [Treponema bryantii]SEQ38942.1 ferrous iron transport protein B [Treponema bryantii]